MRALSPMHRLLAKIIQHNLWPTIRRSDLILKRAQFLYVICLRLPFCLCKHILDVMLEAQDENKTSLPRLLDHSNYSTVWHKCFCRAQDENSGAHKQTNPDEVQCPAKA
jgi:hypothetical protein